MRFCKHDLTLSKPLTANHNLLADVCVLKTEEPYYCFNEITQYYSEIGCKSTMGERQALKR